MSSFTTRKPLQRKQAIGEAKRTQQRIEEGLYPVFEDLLRLHRLSWWHNTIAQRSQPGWPDFTIFGMGWHAWVELKARRYDGRAGKASVAQLRYKNDIEQGGGEWKLFLLPDDWGEIDAWLNERTGHDIHTDGRLR